VHPPKDIVETRVTRFQRATMAQAEFVIDGSCPIGGRLADADFGFVLRQTIEKRRSLADVRRYDVGME
jgi:hypothetical protein